MLKRPSKKIGYVKGKDLAAFRQKNTPTTCPILGHTELIPVVDHDHKSGRIRGVVSSEGNALLGKIENFYRTRCVAAKWLLPEVLRALAEYLEREQGPYHPIGIRQVVKRFSAKSKEVQTAIMREAGLSTQAINECKNSKERAKLFRKQLEKL